MPVHLENEEPVYFKEGMEAEALKKSQEKMTMLTGWFELNKKNEEARIYKYTEIPNHYVWEKKTEF